MSKKKPVKRARSLVLKKSKDNFKFSYFGGKNLTILNIALVLTAVVLFSFLIGAKLPSVGKAAYWLDNTVPVCIASFEGEKSFLNDANLCCSELQKQLRCEVWNEKVLIQGKGVTLDKRCYVGKGTIDYLVNNKQYNYCKKEGYLDYLIA